MSLFIANDVDWLSLPDESWLKILSFLNPSALLKVGLTCKKWRALTLDSSLWKSLHLDCNQIYSLWENDPLFNDLSLRSAKMEKMVRVAKNIIERCTKLEEFTIGHDPWRSEVSNEKLLGSDCAIYCERISESSGCFAGQETQNLALFVLQTSGHRIRKMFIGVDLNIYIDMGILIWVEAVEEQKRDFFLALEEQGMGIVELALPIQNSKYLKLIPNTLARLTNFCCRLGNGWEDDADADRHDAADAIMKEIAEKCVNLRKFCILRFDFAFKDPLLRLGRTRRLASNLTELTIYRGKEDRIHLQGESFVRGGLRPASTCFGHEIGRFTNLVKIVAEVSCYKSLSAIASIKSLRSVTLIDNIEGNRECDSCPDIEKFYRAVFSRGNLQGLETFELTSKCNRFDTEDLESLFRNCSQLRGLFLSLPRMKLEDIANHKCPKLEKLSLFSRYNYGVKQLISKEHLDSICKSCPNLRTLSLRFDEGPSDCGEALSQLHNLRELSLGYTCNWTVVVELAKVVGKCPEICSIFVKNIEPPKLYEQHVELKKALKQLKQILKGDFYWDHEEKD
jgi:hypothetical protein